MMCLFCAILVTIWSLKCNLVHILMCITLLSSLLGSNGGVYKTEIPEVQKGASEHDLCCEKMFNFCEGVVPISEASSQGTHCNTWARKKPTHLRARRQKLKHWTLVGLFPKGAYLPFKFPLWRNKGALILYVIIFRFHP